MMILQQMIAEKRITRHQWTGIDEQGRGTANLLAALHPPCGVEMSAASCPASLMPQWMADLTVWLNDSPSESHWWSVVERYGALAQRFPELDVKRWERASYRIGAAILRIALPLADDEWGCRRAVLGMLACYESAVETGEIDALVRAKWVIAASEATWAAEVAGASEATWAAWAAWAKWPAGAARAALAQEAKRAERADLICDAVLDALEAELTAEKGESA